MANNDLFNLPIGNISMFIHQGGKYDIKKNCFTQDTKIIEKLEIQNLIVSNASILMAMRMAPGKNPTSTGNAGDVFDETKNDYVKFGLSHLALGVGDNGTSSGLVVNPTVSKLKTEICRKPFDGWCFLNQDGSTSINPTNILKVTTTFEDEPHDSPLYDTTAPICEMGLFGGEEGIDSNNIKIDQPDGGIMFNYKTFSTWPKTPDTKLTINWTLTF